MRRPREDWMSSLASLNFNGFIKISITGVIFFPETQGREAEGRRTSGGRLRKEEKQKKNESKLGCPNCDCRGNS